MEEGKGDSPPARGGGVMQSCRVVVSCFIAAEVEVTTDGVHTHTKIVSPLKFEEMAGIYGINPLHPDSGQMSTCVAQYAMHTIVGTVSERIVEAIKQHSHRLEITPHTEVPKA